MDAQHLLHDVGQLLGEALNLRDETRPAGFQAVPQTGDDLAADVQPAEGREHVEDGLADLGDVLDDGRQCLQQAPAQHDDEVRTRCEELGGVIVDDAREVGDDAGQVLDEGGQAVHQALHQADDELDACVHQLPGILAEAVGKAGHDGQRLRQQLRDALHQTCAQLGEHLDAGVQKLGKGGAQAVHQCADDGSAGGQHLRCSCYEALR